MKFFLASILARVGMSRRTGGRETKELLAMLMTSSWVQEVISAGRVEIRLFERSSSKRKEKTFRNKLYATVQETDKRVEYFYFIDCRHFENLMQ